MLEPERTTKPGQFRTRWGANKEVGALRVEIDRLRAGWDALSIELEKQYEVARISKEHITVLAGQVEALREAGENCQDALDAWTTIYERSRDALGEWAGRQHQALGFIAAWREVSGTPKGGEAA